MWLSLRPLLTSRLAAVGGDSAWRLHTVSLSPSLSPSLSLPLSPSLSPSPSLFLFSPSLPVLPTPRSRTLHAGGGGGGGDTLRRQHEAVTDKKKPHVLGGGGGGSQGNPFLSGGTNAEGGEVVHLVVPADADAGRYGALTGVVAAACALGAFAAAVAVVMRARSSRAARGRAAAAQLAVRSRSAGSQL
jgi:hypothetical protein